MINVKLLDWFGSDRHVAEAAWTSSSSTQRSEERVNNLINMLADSKHGSPFEHVLFRFHITCPRYIETQILRHRLQSANCMSGRYRTMPNDFMFMPDDIKMLINNHPSLIDSSKDYEDKCVTNNACYQHYMAKAKVLLKSGELSNPDYKRSREFMRGMLPQSNMTEIVTVINLRSLSNFFKQRLDGNAQPEIQEVADGMLAEVRNANVCPVTLTALERNGWQI
jgi:thymidylate synthase (FAD)